MKESYKPSAEEVKKAEEMMTADQGDEESIEQLFLSGDVSEEILDKDNVDGAKKFLLDFLYKEVKYRSGLHPNDFSPMSFVMFYNPKTGEAKIGSSSSSTFLDHFHKSTVFKRREQNGIKVLGTGYTFDGSGKEATVWEIV